jgi:hypothetical protein
MDYTLQDVKDKVDYMQKHYRIDIKAVDSTPMLPLDLVDITTQDETFVYYHNATSDVAMIFLYGFVKGYSYKGEI